MIKKIVLGLFAAIALFLIIGAFFAYRQTQNLNTVKVTEDLHMITGLGGNVGVLKTGEGTIIVDTMTFTSQGELIRKRAEALTGEPVKIIINTHYHGDHTHGNPGFQNGTQIISTERTLSYLKKVDQSYWEGEASNFLPNGTFVSEKEITLGNKTLKLYQLGPAHTDGDLIVYFVEDKVVHMGDVFFNKQYPNIDLEAGGSVQKWAASMEPVFNLEIDKAIPGHGELGDKTSMRQFQRFMTQLAKVGQDAARRKDDLALTLKTDQLTEDAPWKFLWC